MKIARSDFSKNVLALISGTTIAQIISVGISPILSRIYSPNQFGVFGTFASIIALICLIVGARYEGAILLPKEDKEAANLLALSLFLNVFISLLFFLVILILPFFISNSITASEIYHWFYIAPVFTLFVGLAQSLNSWFNRRKKYKNLVYYRVLNSATNSTSSITLGYAKIPQNGLLCSLLLGNIVSVFVLFYQIKNDYKEFRSHISINTIKILAKRYQHFPFVNSFQSISDAFQINGIIYFISYFFDNFFVGIYSFAMRVLLVPMNFAGAAIAQVFYQHASETYNNNLDLKTLVKSTALKCLLIALPILFVLLFFGPQIFIFIFGNKWGEAGEYARILAPWILMDFIRAPLSQVPIIIGKQKKLLLFSMLNNLLIVACLLYAGIILKDIKKGLFILTVVESLYVFGIIIWIYKISNHKKLYL